MSVRYQSYASYSYWNQLNFLDFPKSVFFFFQNRSFGCPWKSTPVLLPGKSHGLRSLVGYSPWGRKESDMTERLHFYFHQKRSKSELPVYSAKELMLKTMWILSLPRMDCLFLPCFTPFVNKTFPRQLLKKDKKPLMMKSRVLLSLFHFSPDKLNSTSEHSSRLARRVTPLIQGF